MRYTWQKERVGTGSTLLMTVPGQYEMTKYMKISINIRRSFTYFHMRGKAYV